MLVSFESFYSVSLGFSQTIGKLIGTDGSIVSYAKTLESEFFSILTMSFIDCIMSKTYERLYSILFSYTIQSLIPKLN